MPSPLGRLYEQVYGTLAGRHPDYRPWHFQWLFLRETHRWQRRQMSRLCGRVLDVGCGSKPYGGWLPAGPGAVSEHVGLDIEPHPAVDHLVSPTATWPLGDASVEAVLLLQVLEHVQDRGHLLGELRRVLRPGGLLLITVPFLCQGHGQPRDYVRFTPAGLAALLEADFELLECLPLGRAGATLGNLGLTWLDNTLNANRPLRLTRGLLLPLWLALCLLVNTLGALGDLLDRTGTHYANVGVLARRR